MKQQNKVRQVWKTQRRDAKGRFLPKLNYQLKAQHVNFYTINDIEHAFYAGLNSKNSFYLPSKQWEFYKRNRGIE